MTESFVCAQKTVNTREDIKVFINEGVNNNALRIIMEKNASKLLSAFNRAAREKKKPVIPQDIIEARALEKINDLWQTSAMVCEKIHIDENCVTTVYGDYQIRNIPIIMISASKTTKKEEIAIHFNLNGKISDVNITLQEHQYVQILGESKIVEDIVNRNKILDFIEKFRTAYNCKDIDYLDNVFSNNALIITATEIRQQPNSDQAIRGLNDKDYNFQIQTKKEYLKNLNEKVFKKNRYLNIVFDSVKVLQHPGYDNIYGVTVKQQWNSPKYSDVGYLYLLIDCRRENEMQIFVRAWHPEDYFDFGKFDRFRFNN
ncbi:MAG: hypothetical protein LBD80_06795 [Tannerella sp.]|jgi:hypothetical protein|nr:hypothetical protein [Tannerella sp.]